jgi:N-acyl-D-aspartate/D-glutamate deacylase
LAFGAPDLACLRFVQHQAITSEEAVRCLTSDPADMFGIRDRGRLKPGLAADICIYDSATVGSSNRGERRHDLPGGGKRMVMPSRGICYTVVNGRIVYADGALTGDAGGQVLRS